MNREDTAFVYTFSSRGQMTIDLIRSIKSLKKYTDPENIYVFYTPPHNERDEEAVRKLGVNLMKTETETDSFTPLPGKSAGHYGEKTRIGAIDSENAVFLDCDTLVLDDPSQVLEGDFDVKARPDRTTDDSKLEEFFNKHGKSPMNWIPNAGFIVFKNGVHKELAEEWQKFLDTEFEQLQAGYNKDQFALALAMSDYKVREMTSKEHVMEFHGDVTNDGIVYHLVTPDPIQNQVATLLMDKLPYGEKLREVWWKVQQLKS